jgi:hypothetical protein
MKRNKSADIAARAPGFTSRPVSRSSFTAALLILVSGFSAHADDFAAKFSGKSFVRIKSCSNLLIRPATFRMMNLETVMTESWTA